MEVPMDQRASHDDEGGDPPCWLDQVCPDCGALNTEVDGEIPDVLAVRNTTHLNTR